MAHYKALLLLLVAAPAFAIVKTRPVEYKDGELVLQGFVAYEDGFRDKRPGILVVHEWMGLGDYAKKRAVMLAKQGYTAFAADMYGKGVYASDHVEAGKLAGAFFGDRALMRRRALAALAELKKQPYVDGGRLAAIGYCFGGTTALELARAGTELKGVASFHGMLASPMPAEAGGLKAKVAVFHGADDPNIPPAQVQAFHDEMRKAKADWRLTAYGGAVHSFTVPAAGDDPSKGAAYHKDADERSWKALQAFFEELF